MEWVVETCREEYTQLIEYLRVKLELGDYYPYDEIDEILPYQLVLVKYLNDQLYILGSDVMKEKVQKILDIFKDGSENITDNKANELAESIGIDIESSLYNKDRFIYTWNNILAGLVTRLQLQYADLFEQVNESECSCNCCIKGQTQCDYENWSSGVWPEDEQYDRTSASTFNTTGSYDECGCCSEDSTNSSFATKLWADKYKLAKSSVLNTYGLNIITDTNNQEFLSIVKASDTEIKAKTNSYNPIVPSNLDYAVRSVRPKTKDELDEVLEIGVIYDLGEVSNISTELPTTAEVGDIVTIMFLTGSISSIPITITNGNGLNLTTETNKIYTIICEWRRIDSETYGWLLKYTKQ